MLVDDAGEEVHHRTRNTLQILCDLEHAKTLGLRIVHILARRLEATLRVENLAGTRFTISFPVQPQA